MEDFSPSDLKTILHSKRANIYYLQHCRVLVKAGRVEYVTDEGKQSLYWNILLNPQAISVQANWLELPGVCMIWVNILTSFKLGWPVITAKSITQLGVHVSQLSGLEEWVCCWLMV